MDAADFYTGIVAELYAPLKGTSFPWDRSARFIDEHGSPALELGCGDGEPLLDLVARGYDATGVDSSDDMLERLRVEADRRGLTVDVHRQRMEDLALDRRFRSIFLAGPTITLLPDDDTVLQTLLRMREHLAPGGAALVPLWIPRTSDGVVGDVRETTADDGTTLRVTTVSSDRDDRSRLQHTVLRYESAGPGGTRAEERRWTIHWHTPEGFAGLAARAGWIVDAGDTTSDDTASDDSWDVVLRAAVGASG